MYEHNALGYRSGLALCLTKVRSSRARCPATALIYFINGYAVLGFLFPVNCYQNCSILLIELESWDLINFPHSIPLFIKCLQI